jgi:hypothetical protein
MLFLHRQVKQQNQGLLFDIGCSGRTNARMAWIPKSGPVDHGIRFILNVQFFKEEIFYFPLKFKQIIPAEFSPGGTRVTCKPRGFLRDCLAKKPVSSKLVPCDSGHGGEQYIKIS